MKNHYVPVYSGSPYPNFTASTTPDPDLNSPYLQHVANHLLSDHGGGLPELSTFGMLHEEGDEVERVFVFKTESQIEVMNDGFRWRKYGKKRVKSTPYPRHYYKCAEKGCRVKKKVERDKEDPRYIITTYHRVHNHDSDPTAPSPEGHHANFSSAAGSSHC